VFVELRLENWVESISLEGQLLGNSSLVLVFVQAAVFWSAGIAKQL
jgi:hypothetical protein